MAARRIVGTLLLAVLAASCRARAPEGAASSPGSGATVATAKETASEVAVTVDDLPVHGPLTAGTDRLAIADRLLSAFQRHGLTAVYGFVNGKRVVDDPSTEAVLRRWKEAGHVLGNHTYSHVNLNGVSLPDYFADLEKGEEILRKLEPDAAARRMFRYPFLFEGDTDEKRDAVRQYLRDHGYTKAEVSIDADDWAFNRPFSRCAAQNDVATLAKLRRTFVEVHVDELRLVREFSRTIMQREVPQVLLLHIGVADADAIEELLTAYEKEGVKWIELGKALADPFYRLDSGPPARFGAAFPYRVAKARSIKIAPPIFARDLEDELARTCPSDK